jgi:hypothetical protein
VYVDVVVARVYELADRFNMRRRIAGADDLVGDVLFGNELARLLEVTRAGKLLGEVAGQPRIPANM